MSVKVGWITWWPAPYWEPRFESLNGDRQLKLHVFYLQKESTLHGWSESSGRLYPHEYICEKRDNHLGYKLSLKQLWSVFSIRKIFRKRHDILVLPYADVRFIGIIMMCILRKRKYILFCANTKFDERKNSLFKEQIKRNIFRYASAIFATGKAQKEYASRYVKNIELVSIIGNPSVEIGKRQASGTAQINALLGEKKVFTILYVGRLSKEKGLETLVKAVSYIQEYGQEIKIIFVGDGPEKERLLKLSEFENVKTVFTGFIGDLDQLINIYQYSDVFVLPSSSEPWGLVVNEAMNNRLPIILSHRVGCREMLLREGIDGYSFKCGDPHDLENKISLLIDSKDIKRMGDESYRIVQAQNVNAWSMNVTGAILKCLKGTEI